MVALPANSALWRWTMAFTGVGSTMLGPFLPHLLAYWRIHDHEGGMLVASLFLGSFLGTLAMSERLGDCLNRGAWAACLGCLGFAGATQFVRGFVPGLAALSVMGFGMGQLMSSLNLLVGTAPTATRTRELANLSAAWCTGAVVSPCLSTVMVTAASPSLRLALFAPLFLLPLPAAAAWSSLDVQTPCNSGSRVSWTTRIPRGAILCALIFLVYGGVETSISAWLPAFVVRYSGGPLAGAQWILSLFWLGLIAGRMATAAWGAPEAEAMLLRAAIAASVGCLTWLVFTPSFVQALVGSIVLGVCVAPLFPQLLSATLSRSYSNRTMGIILAGCALGSTLLPLLLGLVSNVISLRWAMALPIAGSFVLILLSGSSSEYSRSASRVRDTTRFS
ncbi:MAG TPA: MFS transporter [Acidobacteriaceae bacterium]